MIIPELKARLNDLLAELRRAETDTEEWGNPFFSTEYSFDIDALEEALR